MPVRKSVFGSESERELFTAIRTQWGNRFEVWLSLPFASIVEVAQIDGLTSAEHRYLFSASVDFTLCTRKGRPLLSIEFDGMSHGFSRKGRYVPVKALDNPTRAEHLDLKVRAAASADYPLFVVSYDEKNPIGEKTHLTIVDGIIGQVLAKMAWRKKLGQLPPEERHFIEGLDPTARDEYVQDLVISAEVLAEMEWNPITRASSEIQFRLHDEGINPSGGWRTEWLHEPELPDLPDWTDSRFPEALEARIKALKQVVRVGCRAIIRTVFGDVEETAWVRNIDHFAAHPAGLAEDIAMFLACTRAFELAERRRGGESKGEPVG